MVLEYTKRTENFIEDIPALQEVNVDPQNDFRNQCFEQYDFLVRFAYRTMKGQYYDIKPEDLATIAIEKAIKTSTYNGQVKLSTFLCTILLNTFRDFLRKKKRFIAVPLNDYLINKLSQNNVSEILDARFTKKHVHQLQMLNNIRLRLINASDEEIDGIINELDFYVLSIMPPEITDGFTELNPRARKIILLRDILNLPYKTIGEILNMKHGFIYTCMHKARKTLSSISDVKSLAREKYRIGLGK